MTKHHKKDTLKTALLIITALAALHVTAAAPVKEFAIVLNTTTDDFTILSADVTFEDYPRAWTQNYGDYAWSVSDGEEVLEMSFFDVEGTMFYDEVDPETGEIVGGGQEPYRADTVELYLPYHEDAKRFTVFKVHNQTTMNVTPLIDLELDDYTVSVPKEEDEDVIEAPIDNRTDPNEEQGETSDNRRGAIVFTIVLVAIALLFIILGRRIKQK